MTVNKYYESKINIIKFCLIFLLLTGLIFIFSSGMVRGEQKAELTLEESIELALENNLGYKAAEQELRALEPTIDLARSARYPNLSFSSTYLEMGSGEEMDMTQELDPQDPRYELLKIMEESFEQPDSMFQNEFSLQYPLYTFGRIEGGIKQAEAAYQAGEVGFEGDRQELIHDVISTYYDLLLAREMVSLQDDVKEQVKAHKDMVQSNLDAGMVTELDLYEAEVALSEIEQELLEAKSNLELARDGFRNLVGLPQREEFRLADTDSELVKQLETNILDYVEQSEAEELVGLLEEIERKENSEEILTVAENPNLKQMELQKEALEQELEVIEADKYPTISLMGDYTWEDEGIGFSDSSWSVGINLSFDIFDGGQRQAEMKQAEAELQQLKYTQQELENNLKLETRRALRALSEAQSQQELTDKMLTEAEKQIELAELRYREGVGTSTEVIDAQTGRSQALLADKQADFARIEAVVDLYLVLGQMETLFEEVRQ